MPYEKLQIDVCSWPRVNAFIRRQIEAMFFSDIHVMLRLPIKDQSLDAGCNFAIAHALLAAVSGVSTTLSSTGTLGGGYQRAFKKVLVDYYPWDTESTGPLSTSERQERAQTLWEEFRGPLTHHLGLWVGRRGGSPGYVVKYKRLMAPNGDGISDALISHIERSGSWPLPAFKETLSIRPDAKVLKLERFYWGIRRMIERLTREKQLMAQAEAFLAKA